MAVVGIKLELLLTVKLPADMACMVVADTKNTFKRGLIRSNLADTACKKVVEGIKRKVNPDISRRVAAEATAC